MDLWKSKVAIVTGANLGNGIEIFKKILDCGMIGVAFDLKVDNIEVCLKCFMNN